MDLITTTAGLAILNKLLGKTADKISEDIAGLYEAGRDRLINVARRKVENLDDDKIANLRVAREVFYNGSFADSEIAAEYFGGILASSRSDNGRDDSGIYYTEIIKSLSSKQLYFHYVIYSSLQELFLGDPDKYKELNVGMGAELGKCKIYFSYLELDKELELDVDKNIYALSRVGIIGDHFGFGTEEVDGKGVCFLEVQPNSIGIQLYAVVHNKLQEWRKFNTKSFGILENIPTPTVFVERMEDLPGIESELKRIEEKKERENKK